MKMWSCPQWALVQQVAALVISAVQHLMSSNSHSLVKEFLTVPPFIGMAVTCRVIIACSKFDPGSQGCAAQEPIK